MRKTTRVPVSCEGKSFLKEIERFLSSVADGRGEPPANASLGFPEPTVQVDIQREDVTLHMIVLLKFFCSTLVEDPKHSPQLGRMYTRYWMHLCSC